MFTNDEIINCYLYNRTFHYSEILEHNGTAVFILKSDPITLLTTPVFGHTRLPTTLINVKIQNNTQLSIILDFKSQRNFNETLMKINVSWVNFILMTL